MLTRRYSCAVLGKHDGSIREIVPFGVNASGVVIGWYFKDSTRRAFKWSPGVFEDIDSGTGYSEATGIGDDGTVAGNWYDSAPRSAVSPARESVRVKMLEEPVHAARYGSYTYSRGTAVRHEAEQLWRSSPGGILAGSRHYRASVWRAGVRTAFRGFEPTPEMPTGNPANALCATDAGQATGYGLMNAGPVHACVFMDANNTVDLGTLGGPNSMAKGINTRLTTVGWSHSVPSSYDVTRAFRWRPGEGLQDLGTLGGKSSNAWHVNDHDEIVGGSYTAEGEYHAFLYTDAMYNLNDLTDPPREGAVRLTDASFIGNDGAIAARGILVNENSYVGLLLRPQP